MKSFLMILALGALSSAQAQTSQWVALGGDSTETFFIDYGKISTPAPGLRTMWVTEKRVTPAEHRGPPAFKFDELRSRTSVRCASKQARDDEIVYLLNGTTLEILPPSSTDAFHSITPQSYEEGEAQIACGRAYGARFSSQTHASQWIALGGDSTETVSIDSGTISRPVPGSRILWARTRYVTPVYDSGPPAFKYDEFRSRMTVRCASKEVRFDEIVYLLNGTAQQIVPPDSTDSFHPVDPQTYMVEQAQLACGSAFGARSAAQTHSSHWVRVSGDSTVAFSIDSGTISTPAPGLRTVWTKTMRVTPLEERRVHPAFSYDEALSRITVRCASHEVRFDETVYLLKSVPQRRFPPAPTNPFEPIAPHSAAEATAQIACARP